ncbi:MAG: 1-(5-phosphoribosyl)-5-[(5-phosphoribosylamino)methylideneamino]imidazole-4-carboxamide isomerase [Eubacteriales bacterium]|nr:1-(5-phosphoribosyl)-5-[(5-phosphoribosylamino)methylideneamino]imidazole-4-carboxamide isomerase [Eubacteriales bacterium]
MIILPAIDILGGACVRLVRGEYGSAGKVASDPYTALRSFIADGAQYIHMVDLDGAKEGKTVNHELLCALAAESPVPVQLGGGIRDMETVEFYLENGISRVILGSAALLNPNLVRDAVRHYKDRIAVGIDAYDGKVRISGWLERSETDYIEFARIMEDCGVSNIIFTDIERDGTQSGANCIQLAALSEAVSIDITASGGINDINDIKKLVSMGLYGAITGKAIYSGSLSLREAVEYAGKADNTLS